MKFKSVEISGFRIYDDPKDATFDFGLSKDTVADFVSLYAPNGFGKTSFYDAVEWGITKNIYRFWQNQTTEMSLATLKDLQKEQVKLWRNRNSSRKRKSYVKITPLTGDPISRELKAHGNSSSDISGKDTVENKNFRQVILSQEWISAFLKEMNGARRYEIFMENPQLQSVESYYKSTKELLSVCSDRIAGLYNRINNEQANLITTSTGNVLAMVNDQVKLLNDNYQQALNILLISSTQEDIFRFQALISENRIRISNTSGLQNLIERIDQAINGKTGELLSLTLYFERIVELSLKKVDLTTCDEHLKNFETLSQQTNLVTVKKQQQEDLLRQKTGIEIINSKYPVFESVSNDIKIKIGLKEKADAQIQSETAKKDTSEGRSLQLRAGLDGIVSQIDVIQQQISRVPNIIKQLEDNEREINAQTVSLSANQKSEQDCQRRKALAQASIAIIQDAIASIDNGNYTMPTEEEAKQFQELISDLRQRQSRITPLDQELAVLNKTIEEQESLNSALQDFVAEGLKIIDATKTGICPLCEHDYQDYENLAKRISQNKVLSQLLQSQYGSRSLLITEKNNHLEILDSGRRQLKEYLNAKIAIEQQENNNIDTELTSIKRSQVLLDQTITRLTGDKRNLLVALEGKSVEEYTTQLTERHRKLEEEKVVAEKNFWDENATLNAFKIQVNNLTSEAAALSEQVATLRDTPDYVEVLNWFLHKFPSGEFTTTILQAEEQRIENDLKSIREQIQGVNELTERLQKQLASVTKEAQIKHREELNALLERYSMEISAYESFLRSLGLKSIPVNIQDALDQLTIMKDQYRETIKRNAEMTEEYLKLEDLCTKLTPFLQSELAREKIRQAQIEVAYLETDVKPALETEKEKIKKYLEERVKSFFYTGLINSIYNRIDPHPDFKSVVFRPDFDSETPSLDVFVVNHKNEESLIPNLYFSTAQINILSLSIFLASALNNDEYDCIFIDDPIQSMDSINILSTIDLLRSIVQTGHKQIILSTHDENFHKLLSKKIPPTHFKSKFMSLETFGKVMAEKIPEEPVSEEKKT